MFSAHAGNVSKITEECLSSFAFTDFWWVTLHLKQTLHLQIQISSYYKFIWLYVTLYKMLYSTTLLRNAPHIKLIMEKRSLNFTTRKSHLQNVQTYVKQLKLLRRKDRNLWRGKSQEFGHYWQPQKR